MKISRSALLPYSAQQMYDVVADIGAYPAFLNWCEASEILSSAEHEVVARLVISYSKLNIEFVTRNLNKPYQSIGLSLVDGPFTRLAGQWMFISLDDSACKVSIDMEFDFSRSFAKRMMGKVFANIISTQLDAFQNRAKHLYGNGNAPN